MQPEALSEIQDFLELTPFLLTAGQPLEEQIPLISQAGCQVVINLATAASPDWIPDERERCQTLGLDYISIPVEWTSPRSEDLRRYFDALVSNHERKVFVHCARNMRVSAFTFLYRVVVLQENETACRVDLDKIWQPNEVWDQFIQETLGKR